jgi:hypothetical protein
MFKKNNQFFNLSYRSRLISALNLNSTQLFCESLRPFQPKKETNYKNNVKLVENE